jgi:hypothetical protein
MESLDLRPIRKRHREERFRMMGDREPVADLPVLFRGEMRLPDVIRLGVEFRGEKVERFVGEAEALAPLMDAAFAEKDGLPAGGERVADHLPLFESDGHTLLKIDYWGLEISENFLEH